MKTGGRGLIVCWAYEQTDDIELKKGDQYIGGRGRAGGERYYYCYDRESFKEYTSNISISRGHIWWQKGNWIFEFTK